MGLERVERRQSEGIFVYIAYVDDSGQGGNVNEQPIQVIGGPLIKSHEFSDLRIFITAELIKAFGPNNVEAWDNFEFHAHRMFHATEEPYKTIGEEKCKELLKYALEQIALFNIPIIYATLDSRLFAGTPLEGAINILDVCCAQYFVSLENSQLSLFNWMLEPTLVIGDANPEEKGSRFRGSLTRAFRKTLTRLRDRMDYMGEEVMASKLYLFDDIYFGDSKGSLGLQLADICMFFIHRHLLGKADAEGFYKIIEPHLKEAPPFSLAEVQSR